MTPRKLVFLLCCAVFGSAVINHFTILRNTVAQTNGRVVRVATASGPIGGTVSVPIELVSQDDENAIGFSLSFDPATLSNPVAVIGADATGAGFNVNTNQAGQGRMGIALALPANQKFPAGVRQLVVITFDVSASASFGTTAINFSDQPVSREISDVNANALSATYTAGLVNITKGFEADLTPRPDGDNNGTVTITDWVQLGRFVAGLDIAEPGNEFQRADCAPRDTLGDGRISITDWTQAGRYAAALDPVVAAGGPTVPNQASLSRRQTKALNKKPAFVSGRLQPLSFNGRNRIQKRQLTIEMDAQGNENALGFSLQFNASDWRLVEASPGRDAFGTLLHINLNQAERGRIGFVLAMATGKTLAAGSRQLLLCSFEPIAGRKSSTLAVGFSDFPVRREIADAEAVSLATEFSLDGSDCGPLSNVSAASFESDELAPEQIVSAFGANLAVGIEAASTIPLPTRLADTTVIIADNSGNERPAPLFFVSPNQINYLIPQDAVEGMATVTVTNNAQSVSIGSINITRVSPGLFTANADGQGVAAAVTLRMKADGSQQFEPLAEFDASLKRFVARPLKLAAEGDRLYLILFGTGWSQVSNAGTVRARLGDMQIPVSYAGRQGEMPGVDQINLLLPHGLRHQGELKLEVTIDGKKANPVWLKVANP